MSSTHVTGPAQGVVHAFVINYLELPQQRSDFAIDLNGDGRPDNQLGSIVSALAAQNLDLQTDLAMNVANGTLVDLIRVVDDETPDLHPMGITILAGLSQPAPQFMGKDTLAVDDSIAGADLLGESAAGQFKSNPPCSQPPVPLLLRLPMLGTTFNLALTDAHVQFTFGTDMASGAPGLLNGQIHGTIDGAVFDAEVIPKMAAYLTALLMSDPGDHPDLERIFDVGGCSDDGVPAVAGDFVISLCEMAENQITMNVTAPDVDIFDSNGRYDPNVRNSDKDSISLGLGFTAVQASF